LKLINVTQEGRLLRIALNRPEKRNALNLAMCERILETLDRVSDDSSVGAILIAGNGPVFCAGMDLKDSLEADPVQLAQVHDRLFSVVYRIRKPIIAAVHGAALAAGAGLAANAHIVVAHPATRFALTEIRLGLWPVMIFRALKLAVGERRATELSLTGRDFTAAEGFQYGLVSELSDDPAKRAGEIAARLCEYSTLAISTGLDYVHQIRERDWDDADRIGRDLRDRLLQSDTYKEAVHAFINRR
jgi:enoyl-CoA hydratase/carnithine racemase